MRLTYVTDVYGMGGAERALTQFADYWNKEDHKVTVIVADVFMSYQGTSYDQTFYALNPKVSLQRIPLDKQTPNLPRKIRILFNLLRLRRAIQRSDPDLVLGFKDEGAINSLVSLLGTNIPVIAMLRSDPSHTPLADMLVRLRARFLVNAAAITCQSERSLEFFTPSQRKKAVAIPNVVPEPGEPTKERAQRERVIVSISRLERTQKRLDRLIQAFVILAPDFPEWNVELWGDGPDREDLTKMIFDANLSDRIRLCGKTSEVPRVLKRAGIFALTSAFEGFPNGLAEAMAQGTPVISYDCPTGPSDIIRPGCDGILATNDEEFVEGLRRLMADETLRDEFARNATQISARFSESPIMARWRNLFESVVKSGTGT